MRRLAWECRYALVIVHGTCGAARSSHLRGQSLHSVEGPLDATRPSVARPFVCLALIGDLWVIARSRSTSVGAHWRGRSSGIPVEEEVVIGDDIGILIATNDVVGSGPTTSRLARPPLRMCTRGLPTPQNHKKAARLLQSKAEARIMKALQLRERHRRAF